MAAGTGLLSSKKLLAGGTVLVLATGLFVQQGGLSLFGQKLEERNISYHKTYDGWWDVACDAAMDGGETRCYMQYVDVYEPQPNLRAAMVELTYARDDNGNSQPTLVFNIESGMDFAKSSMRVEKAEATSMDLSFGSCTGAECSLSGEQAKTILASWRGGETLTLSLSEADGSDVIRNWPLQNMATILDDLASQRASRNLP